MSVRGLRVPGLVMVAALVAASLVVSPTGAAPPKSARANAAQSGVTSGAGWVAYIGDDGNVWLMRPDGSDQQQVTHDGSHGSGSPSYSGMDWSPDGTILVFSRWSEPGAGIYLYRDGQVSAVPGSAGCHSPGITPDNSRLLYSCAPNGMNSRSELVPGQLQSDPRLAAVASSNLDGSDARVLVPYALTETGETGIPWVNSGLVGFNGLSGLDVAANGRILATFGFLHSATAYVISPDGALLTDIPYSDSNKDHLGPFEAQFLPGSDRIIATVCERGCYPPYKDQVRSLSILDTDGSIVSRLAGTDTLPGLSDFTVSPDGSILIFSARGETSTDATLWRMPLLGGPATKLGAGSLPAWQPVPAEIALPGAAGDTTPGEAATPADGSASLQATRAAQQVVGSVEEATQPTRPTQASATQPAAPMPAATVAPSPPRQTGGSALPATGQLAYGLKSGNHWDVWVRDFDTGQNRQLTAEPDSDQWAPAWSHDGSQLAFLSDTSGTNQVWLMDPDGSNQRQISTWGGDTIVAVAWSGDDRSLYVTVQGDAAKRIMQMSANGGSLTGLIPASSSAPVAVPDQNLLIYVSDGETNPRIVFARAGLSTTVFAGDAPTVGGGLIACQTGDKGSRRIVIHDLNGNQVNSPATSGDASGPALTSDGATLFYVADSTRVVAWDTEDATAAPVATAPGDAVWYLAWRSGS